MSSVFYGVIWDKILEVLAVVLNLLFTILYLNSNPWCYLFGILGPLMFILLCYRNKLYAEPVLQLFYIAFAVYGWMNQGEYWNIVHWPLEIHILYVLTGIVVAIAAGYFLKSRTDAQLPWLDSVVTVFGIIGTWMMVNYVHENWLYFIAINAVSIYIYKKRSLYFGMALFVFYLLMSIDGYFELKIFYA